MKLFIATNKNSNFQILKNEVTQNILAHTLRTKEARYSHNKTCIGKTTYLVNKQKTNAQSDDSAMNSIYSQALI
jgi:hypothetical protein